ncbi:MAG: hypothetical protein H0X51_02630 [Parachlamydiaceae bacterium]|nr:hypothetical protein [Parachlamydiaceae bacterium]
MLDRVDGKTATKTTLPATTGRFSSCRDVCSKTLRAVIELIKWLSCCPTIFSCCRQRDSLKHRAGSVSTSVDSSTTDRKSTAAAMSLGSSSSPKVEKLSPEQQARERDKAEIKTFLNNLMWNRASEAEQLKLYPRIAESTVLQGYIQEELATYEFNKLGGLFVKINVIFRSCLLTEVTKENTMRPGRQALTEVLTQAGKKILLKTSFDDCTFVENHAHLFYYKIFKLCTESETESFQKQIANLPVDFTKNGPKDCIFDGLPSAFKKKYFRDLPFGTILNFVSNNNPTEDRRGKYFDALGWLLGDVLENNYLKSEDLRSLQETLKQKYPSNQGYSPLDSLINRVCAMTKESAPESKDDTKVSDS